MARRFYSDTEIEYIMKHFPDQLTQDIADHLGRSYSSISQKARDLGLKKSEAFKRDPVKSGHINLLIEGKKTRFKKGDDPWNKGIEFEAGGRSVETRFQEGNLPHNTKHDGAITIRHQKGRKELWIRLELKKWTPLRLHIWRQANGPVPKGHVVIFKDGNTLNPQLENLECISREENMRRNTIHRYPEELKQSIRALNKLRKAIEHAEE
jgi:hypothetical protein